MHKLVYAVLLRDYNHALELYEHLSPLELSISERTRIIQGLFVKDYIISKYSADLDLIGYKIRRFQSITPELPFALPESFFIQQVCNRVYGVDPVCYDMQNLLFQWMEHTLDTEQEDILSLCMKHLNLFDFLLGDDVSRLQFIEETQNSLVLHILQLGIFGDVREVELRSGKEALVRQIILSHIANTPRKHNIETEMDD